MLICSSIEFSTGNHSKSKFTAGADLYSNYIFREQVWQVHLSNQRKYISGVYSRSLGSFDASGYAETDPYLSIHFFWIKPGVTDYYYPGLTCSIYQRQLEVRPLNKCSFTKWDSHLVPIIL